MHSWSTWYNVETINCYIFSSLSCLFHAVRLSDVAQTPCKNCILSETMQGCRMCLKINYFSSSRKTQKKFMCTDKTFWVRKLIFYHFQQILTSHLHFSDDVGTFWGDFPYARHGWLQKQIHKVWSTWWEKAANYYIYDDIKLPFRIRP